MATSTITIKKDTTSNWTTSARVLDDGELGLEIATNGHRILRVGDGITPFMDLPVTFDIEEIRAIKQDMDTNAAEYIAGIVAKGEELLEEMKKRESTVILTDEETGIKYIMGLSGGTMYFEEAPVETE